MLIDIIRLVNKSIDAREHLAVSTEKYKNYRGDDYLAKHPQVAAKLSGIEDSVSKHFEELKFSILHDFHCSLKFTISLFKKLKEMSVNEERLGELSVFEKIIKPMILEDKVSLSKNDFMFCIKEFNVFSINKILKDPLFKDHSNQLLAWILEDRASNISKINLSLLLKGKDFLKIADEMEDIQSFLDNIHENKSLDSKYKDEAIFDIIFPPENTTPSSPVEFDSGMESSSPGPDSLRPILGDASGCD